MYVGYVFMILPIIGIHPSHLKLNDSLPVFVPSPNVPNPVGDRLKTLLNPDEPGIEDSDSNVDALSKSLQFLRAKIYEETRKKKYWEEKYHETFAEKEKLRKLVDLRNKQISKLKNKTVSKSEKIKILKEILKETNFSEAIYGIFTFKN